MKNIFFIFSATCLFSACGGGKPEPVELNTDACSFCKMTISDGKFACELITDKGKIYKFDDLHCMAGFSKEKQTKGADFFVSDYESSALLPAGAAFYIRGGEIKSPMGGNTAAFSSETKAKDFSQKLNAQSVSEQELGFRQ